MVYQTAKEAAFHSRNSGKETSCEPTMENYTDLVEDCQERRLQEDGSIVFISNDHEWRVRMMRRPW